MSGNAVQDPLAEVARRVAGGDQAAFAELVAATTPQLYRLALRMTGDGDDAEDVLQEAFVRAHRALVSGEWRERARVETWLYRIVLNAALNFRRGRQRRARLVDVREPEAPRQETQVAMRQLMQLLQTLPDEQRSAIVLKELEGMTSAEIAAVLGCSEGAVEQRLVRARATLRMRWRHE